MYFTLNIKSTFSNQKKRACLSFTQFTQIPCFAVRLNLVKLFVITQNLLPAIGMQNRTIMHLQEVFEFLKHVSVHGVVCFIEAPDFILQNKRDNFLLNHFPHDTHFFLLRSETVLLHRIHTQIMFNETFRSRFVHNGSHKTFKIEKSPRSRVSINQNSIILDSTPFDFRSIRSRHIQSIRMTPTIDPVSHVPQIITRFSFFVTILIRGGDDHETTLDLHHDSQKRNDSTP